MFSVSINEYTLLCLSQGLPDIYSEYAKHAELAEEFDIRDSEGESCFLAVAKASGWPFLVIAQLYDPSVASGFNPGALIVPETNLLFVGAGTRLLAYDLSIPRQIWEDVADIGFWGWARHNEYVVMSAELELAAWDIHGRKLWSAFAEPPWGYKVVEGRVELDVMGKKSNFPIDTGPA
jgi:hypothetical protein